MLHLKRSSLWDVRRLTEGAAQQEEVEALLAAHEQRMACLSSVLDGTDPASPQAGPLQSQR